MRRNLRQAREAMGLTQAEVAKKVFVCHKHYSEIERGIAVGSVDVWDELEDLFGINQRKLREDT